MPNDATTKVKISPSDLRGIGRLTIDAVTGVVGIVEAMHLNIASAPRVLRTARRDRTTGITGLVYRSVRGIVGVVGHGLDRFLARLEPLLGKRSTWPGREALLAVLNGVLGDYLEASANPLAIRMCLRRDGRALPSDTRALAAAIPPPADRLVVLLHGLCMNDLQWNRKDHDHGAALSRDLGFTAVYLHYNSGRHISVNGREFAGIMEALVPAWPVPLKQLVLVGHSMGGLVARSALHYGAAAGHEWVRRVDKLVFLGTPHHGAPLERGGNWVDTLFGVSPYVAPFARLGKIRSAGITDLRYGNLVDEDWAGRDRFARTGDVRRAVPLPEGIACYAIAATRGKRMGGLHDRLIGDGIVPLRSALGQHSNVRLTLPFPPSRQWVGCGMNHLALLDRPDVYAKIRHWLSSEGPAKCEEDTDNP
jgi:pimeloyl-ACP methyl ester carboxylesterase